MPLMQPSARPSCDFFTPSSRNLQMPDQYSHRLHGGARRWRTPTRFSNLRLPAWVRPTQVTNARLVKNPGISRKKYEIV